MVLMKNIVGLSQISIKYLSLSTVRSDSHFDLTKQNRTAQMLM